MRQSRWTPSGQKTVLLTQGSVGPKAGDEVVVVVVGGGVMGGVEEEWDVVVTGGRMMVMGCPMPMPRNGVDEVEVRV